MLAGETELFAQIVELHEAELWRVVAASLNDRVSCENLVQQCFVNAYENLQQYTLGRDLGAWLRGIARNVMREEFRRTSRESDRMVHYREYLDVLYADDDRATLEQERLARALRQCRGGLAADPAKVVQLHYEEGRSLEEVAGVIGRSVAATKQLLFRTRAVLRACVESRLAPD